MCVHVYVVPSIDALASLYASIHKPLHSLVESIYVLYRYIHCCMCHCSAAVDVIGTMSMDAFVSQTGLKLATTLHTSTEAAGLIQLQQGKVFNIDINMPRENIEILSIE